MMLALDQAGALPALSHRVDAITRPVMEPRCRVAMPRHRSILLSFKQNLTFGSRINPLSDSN